MLLADRALLLFGSGRGTVALVEPVRALVIARATRVKYERHQSNAYDEREKNAERHGDVALFGNLNVRTGYQSLIAEPDRRGEKCQQHANDDPGSRFHSDSTRKIAPCALIPSCNLNSRTSDKPYPFHGIVAPFRLATASAMASVSA